MGAFLPGGERHVHIDCCNRVERAVDRGDDNGHANRLDANTLNRDMTAVSARLDVGQRAIKRIICVHK